MCRRARGSCIILPFPCETGGPPVPCVYVLHSLTWCNGTCGNNSGGMASQRESVKTLRFSKTSLLQSEYHLCSNGWSVALLCYRNQISYFLRFEPLREPITAVAMELNTFICTKRHFFCHLAASVVTFFQNSQHLLCQEFVCSLRQGTQKCPRHSHFLLTLNI